MKQKRELIRRENKERGQKKRGIKRKNRERGRHLNVLTAKI